jgi:adenine deaminase
VPATGFETAGATLNAYHVDELLSRDDILYLSEMMNFPGVLHGDEQVMRKIASAKKYGKPVDGHAPGLRDTAAKQYTEVGITTDHECYTLEEAEEKLKLGMNILIREGSAAQNFEALIPLFEHYPGKIMFCSDDKHPDGLLLGHINQLVARAVAKGYDLFDVLQAACINPVKHYRLPIGRLRVGDAADFIITSDLRNFAIDQTYIRGRLVADKGISLIRSVPVVPVNRFNIPEKVVSDFQYSPNAQEWVIECLDGQLITNKLLLEASQCTVKNDVLKLVVVNRYCEAPVAKAWIKNMGLRRGAIASSVAHDSHNIIAVGTTDEEICHAVNLVIRHKGGLSAVDGSNQKILPLPVAGLMSTDDAWKVSADYSELDRMSRELGSSLRAPFMSLSFMALLVIPHLKLSDKGLFDGDTFTFTNTY